MAATATNGSSVVASSVSAAAKLRLDLANPDKIIVCPGVFDGFSARMALNAGFDAMYMVSVISNGTNGMTPDSLYILELVHPYLD